MPSDVATRGHSKLGIGSSARNERIETEVRMHRKCAPHWFGPYIITDKSEGMGTYHLRELDGTELKERIAGKRLKKFRRWDTAATSSGHDWAQREEDKGEDGEDEEE